MRVCVCAVYFCLVFVCTRVFVYPCVHVYMCVHVCDYTYIKTHMYMFPEWGQDGEREWARSRGCPMNVLESLNSRVSLNLALSAVGSHGGCVSWETAGCPWKRARDGPEAERALGVL